MLKMLINEEEVVSNKDFTIKKEMLNTPSVILNNVYPKTWEEDKDYTSRFYHPNDYSKCKIVDETYIPPEEGKTITSNTGVIYINDANNNKEKNYKVLGKTEQNKSVSGIGNLFNINSTPFIPRVAYNSSGVQQNWDNYSGTTTKTPIQSSTTYTITEDKNTYTTYIVEYDSSETFIQRLVLSHYNKTFTTSSNTKYINISVSSEIVPTKVQIEEGTTAHTPVPYGHWLPIKIANSNDTSAEDYQEQTSLIDLNKYDENNNIIGNYEICSIGDTKDLLTIKDGKAVLNKNITNIVLDGSDDEGWGYSSSNVLFVTDIIRNVAEHNNEMFCSHFTIVPMSTTYANMPNGTIRQDNNSSRLIIKYTSYTNVNNFKNWLSTHNTTLYYVLATPETITLRGDYNINLYEGINYINIVNSDLIPTTILHYNYTNEKIITDLLFCGIVKNSGNISLNPRYPHYSTLQILDFKNFLSEGELDAFVISKKTILEAINMVIDSISSYGFVLGNINILNQNEIIGAYSTKDKSAYDVFSYIADITQSRWTTRVIDENTVAIDFYDPTLMEQGTTIEYTQEFFENNLIDDISYSYGTNDYRNKQIMTSNQVYSNISQNQSIVADGYQTQFGTDQIIGQILSITSNNKNLTFATNSAKELGFTADFYYTPGNNYFESADLRTTGEVLNVEYISLVEGRQIITNPSEIQRVSNSINRKGVVNRYENRNDAITSNELQLIGQSYIKYKGTPEIVLKINSRSNLWEIGQRVQFNAPIDELNTEYMVRSKEINYIATIDTIFYTYELTSSFNSETAINYFDNQRAKAKGNIGEGEYISRNVDIESNANIIFYDTQATEITTIGDNSLNSVLNAPFIN